MQTKGIVTLTLKNADGSVAKKEVIENHIIRLLSNTFPNYNFDDQKLIASPIKIDDNIRIGYYAIPGRGVSRLSGITRSGYDVSSDLTLPLTYETTYRFESDGNSHAINSLALTSSYMNTLVKLLNEFIQGPTQVLEIKYQLVFEFKQTNHIDIYRKKYVINKYIRGNYPYLSRAFMRDTGRFRNEFLNVRTEFTNTTTSVSDHYSDMGISKNSEISRRFYQLVDLPSYYCSPIDIESPEHHSKDYPFGALYNHSKNTVAWYEDLSNLATGKGYPAITFTGNNDGYTSPTEAEFAEIIISKDGNVGTATYNKRIRPIFDYQAAYGVASSIIPTELVSNLSNHYFSKDYPTSIDNPMKQINTNWSFYDETTIMLSTTDCLALFNVSNGKYHQVDSTHGFPLKSGQNNRANICRDNQGSIYILSSTKLIKIDDPLGTPVVTVKDQTDLGIGTSTLKCISHSVGNKLMLVTSTNIMTSSDNGDTWTTLSGITGEESGRHVSEIVEIYSNPIKENEHVVRFSGRHYSWFNSTTEELIPVNIANSYYQTEGSTDRVICDPKYGIWMFKYHGDAYASCVQFVKFGTNDTIGATGDGKESGQSYHSYFFKCIDFKYDSLGNLAAIEDYVYDHDIHNNGTRTLANFKIFNAKYPADGFTSNAKVLRYKTINNDYDYHNYLRLILRKVGNTLRIYRDDKYYASALPHTDNNKKDVLPFTSIGLEREEISGGFLIQKWNGTEWTYDNNPEPQDGVGTVAADGKRVNFPVNYRKFNGRSYLDISATIENTDLSTDGISIAGKFTPRIKERTPRHSDNNPNYIVPTAPTSTLCSFLDVENNRTVDVMLVGYNNEVCIRDRTDDTEALHNLGAETVIDELKNVVVTINGAGDTIELFINNVSKGSVTLTNALSMDTSGSDELKIVIASTQFNTMFNVPCYDELFDGEITHVCVYNKVLDATDIDTLHNTGILSNPNLLTRYLIASDDYNEGKPTSTSESFSPIVNLEFTEGDLSDDSYKKGDIYNVACCKYGILKGNAESFTLTSLHYPGIKKITEIHPVGGAGNIVPSGSVTQKIRCFSRYTRTYGGEGSSFEIVTGKNLVRTVVSPVVTKEFNSDYEVEFTISAWHNLTKTHLALRKYIYNSNLSDTQNQVYVKFQANGNDVDISLYTRDSAETLIGTIPIDLGDKFKLSVVGTTATFYKWDNSQWTSVGSAPFSTRDCKFFGIFVNEGNDNSNDTRVFISEVFCTTELREGTMVLGSQALQTGVYDPNFRGYLEKSNKIEVYADGELLDFGNGTPTWVISNGSSGKYFVNVPESVPVSGSVSFNACGMVTFNASEFGKAITLPHAYYSIY